MERTQAAALRLSEAVRDRIGRLWDLHEAGQLTRSEFRATASGLVARANTAGVQLADIGLAAEVTRQLRQPSAPLGLAPNAVQVDADRLARDIDRIVDEPPATIDPADLSASRRSRLGEWARTEPLLTVATAVQAGMAAREANGWVRQLDADPCRLCIGWADGVVRAPTTRMKRHPGCGCVQAPVFSRDVTSDRENVNRLTDDDLLAAAAARNPSQAVDTLMGDLDAIIARRDTTRPTPDTSGGFFFNP